MQESGFPALVALLTGKNAHTPANCGDPAAAIAQECRPGNACPVVPRRPAEDNPPLIHTVPPQRACSHIAETSMNAGQLAPPADAVSALRRIGVCVVIGLSEATDLRGGYRATR